MRQLFLLAGVLLLAGCDWEDFGSSDRYSTDFHYNYPLKAGGTVSLENFNGSVDVSGWDQDAVDVSGAKYGATPEARDAIKIEVTPSSGSVAIRTIRPSERRNVGARYVIKVPRRSQLDRIASSNGSVRVSDIEGPVRVKTSNGPLRLLNIGGRVDGGTSNGSIEMDNVKGDSTVRTSNGRVKGQGLQGALDVSTSNGSADLSVAGLRSAGVRISTSNGSITLRLASNVNARLMARTSNSSVKTDFEVLTHTSEKHRLEGTIGSGGPLLDLSTSNGSIHIVKQ